MFRFAWSREAQERLSEHVEKLIEGLEEPRRTWVKRCSGLAKPTAGYVDLANEIGKSAAGIREIIVNTFRDIGYEMIRERSLPQELFLTWSSQEQAIFVDHIQDIHSVWRDWPRETGATPYAVRTALYDLVCAEVLKNRPSMDDVAALDIAVVRKVLGPGTEILQEYLGRWGRRFVGDLLKPEVSVAEDMLRTLQEGGFSIRKTKPKADRTQAAQNSQAKLKISDLPRNVRRACNVLRVESLESLANHSADELLAIKGFGMAALSKVRTVLASCGLQLMGS